jgi:hypothetical protein
MAAILGFRFEQDYTTPPLAELVVIPDGHVLARPEGGSTARSGRRSATWFGASWASSSMWTSRSEEAERDAEHEEASREYDQRPASGSNDAPGWGQAQAPYTTQREQYPAKTPPNGRAAHLWTTELGNLPVCKPKNQARRGISAFMWQTRPC